MAAAATPPTTPPTIAPTLVELPWLAGLATGPCVGGGLGAGGDASMTTDCMEEVTLYPGRMTQGMTDELQHMANPEAG